MQEKYDYIKKKDKYLFQYQVIQMLGWNNAVYQREFRDFVGRQDGNIIS